MESLAIIPRCEIAIREATMNDLPFIDSLQKMHSKMVGWMPTKQLEGKIAAGQVLMAEGEAVGGEAVKREDADCFTASQLHCVTSLGYCIAQDRYFKHDDIGIIYQLNVLPTNQRKLIGAALLKAVF